MGIRKLGEQSIRKLTKIGSHSLGLTLPVELVRKLGWKEKQRVVVKAKGKTLVIKDWRK